MQETGQKGGGIETAIDLNTIALIFQIIFNHQYISADYL